MRSRSTSVQSLRGLGLLLAAGGLALLAQACETEVYLNRERSLNPEEPSCSNRGKCVADPTARCIDPDRCASSMNCPVGTRCALKRVAVVDASADAAGSPDASQPTARIYEYFRGCELPAPDTEDPFVLINGFGLPPLDVRRVPESHPPAFTWTTPPGARAIECTVFGCWPEVTSSLDRTRWISNSSMCSLTTVGVGLLAAGGYDLGQINSSIQYLRRHSSEDTCVPADRHRSILPTISTLQLGCMAYDEIRLIAVSRLLPLEPDDARAIRELISEDCTKATADPVPANCYLREQKTYGTCVGTVCKRRCLKDSDCEIADAGTGKCGRPDEYSVGVCTD